MLFWIILIIVPSLFAFYARSRVTSAYSKNLQIESRGHITGREAAQAVLQSAGINDVEIVEVEGQLSDHFDPVHRRLALSEQNFHGTSLAALGVSAHEAGHAIQAKVGYSMMKLRQVLVPAAQIASPVAWLVTAAGVFMISLLASSVMGLLVIKIGAAALAVIALFQLVTLPVEFDASRRAKAQLVNLGILDADEMVGVNETLDAAALTYVAAFVSTLGYLLYLLLLLNGGRRND
ncbi:MAG TPA: zinc metallopeptidase [Candidatus Didemnitutus sp.]|nr:zinc metallopeptidase [Candidatus Didemnitutus sp.]